MVVFDTGKWQSGRSRQSCPPEAGPLFAEKLLSKFCMPCVYVLLSLKTGNSYTGSSREETPDVRIKSHNAGKVRSTRFGRPWKLVLVELYIDYTVARKRELFLKSGIGRKWLKEYLTTQQ